MEKYFDPKNISFILRIFFSLQGKKVKDYESISQ